MFYNILFINMYTYQMNLKIDETVEKALKSKPCRHLFSTSYYKNPVNKQDKLEDLKIKHLMLFVRKYPYSSPG